MIEKSGRKNQNEFSSSVTPILIVGNDRLTPYIQVFFHQPENIVQHSLGCLFGVFKIDAADVDSAFIVNFLVSEIKKEYYGNPRRTPAGSFEAGLNRINIALSELAKQGNISWMGKLESAICALEKNGMIHFSVTGPSHIALFREGSLSLISEGLASETNIPNPLKTFTEISSGKLHPEDMVILGSRELFEFLPQEKMERSARHFSYEEFTRFLHTALVNEFDFCGAVTALVRKKPLPETKKKISTGVSAEDIPNLWGTSSFQKNSSDASSRKSLPEKIENADLPISENRRDGHIYIQQKSSRSDSPRQEFKESLLILREHFANVVDARWETFRATARQWRRTLQKTAHTVRENMPSKMQDTLEMPPASNSAPIGTPACSPQQFPQQKTSVPVKKPPIFTQPKKKSETNPTRVLHEMHSQKNLKKKKFLLQETRFSEESPLKSDSEHVPRKLRKISEKLLTAREKQYIPSVSKIEILPPLFKKSITFFKSCSFAIRKKCNRKNFQNIPALFGRCVPAFHFLQNNVRSVARSIIQIVKKSLPFFRRLFIRFQVLPANYRIVGTITLSLVILSGIAFLVISLLPQTSEQKTTPLSESTNATNSESAQIPSEPSNQLPSAQTASVYVSQNEIFDLFPIDNETLVVAEDYFITLVSEKTPLQSFPLPSENGRVIDATYMKDLSLLFLLTEKGTLLSFSPVSKKFSPTNLSFDALSRKKLLLGSYLTYLYIANTEESTILRYPRAEGGFSDPIVWFPSTQNVSFSETAAFFVHESAYLAKQNTLLHFSRNTLDTWKLALSSGTPPTEIRSVFVSSDAGSILLTDTTQNTLFLFSQNGDFLQEIPLSKDNSFVLGAVMTPNGKIYIRTNREIQSILQGR